MRKFWKLSLTVVFALFALNASAQWYAGGSATIKLTDDHQSVTLSPEGGFWLDDTWAVGGIIDIAANNDYGTFVLKPYARYAFMQLGPVTAVAEAFVPIGVQDGDFLLGASVGPAILIPFTDKFSFTTRLGSLGFVAGPDTDNFHLTAGPVSFGLYYSF
ncbi:MAG: hypothetical protein K5984_02840 [Bacteroidales bacterium]|nr:hypothetical protein [Bacteroidales bacterium]